MQAIVYKSTGSWYQVKTITGKNYQARIKGVFKTEGFSSTNPIAVGDIVEIEEDTASEQTAIIVSIHPRKNYVIRSSPHNKYQHHIIASNLDQTLLFATLKHPKTSNGFIDRFLISAEAYNVPAILVFNKIDLYGDKEMDLLQHYQDIYTKIGYTVIGISLANQTDLEKLTGLLHNKTTLLSGHSGVGKSTFINNIFPEKNVKTKAVSQWSGKGMHTTTFAEMFDLPTGGSIIDTPGIREFGLVDITPEELAHYFPEIKAQMHLCKFNNCQHINEPQCAIKQDLQSTHPSIAIDRYNSYLTILNSL